MVKHYAEDKEFIYGLDIKHLDEMNEGALTMAQYTPPEQAEGHAVGRHRLRGRRDLRGALAAALHGLRRRCEGDAKRSRTRPGKPSAKPLRRSSSGRSWATRAAAAHDIIQNQFDYSIDWLQLVIMALVLIGYFVFLFAPRTRNTAK